MHTGAWYDGWETRRHNPEPYDWVVIKLGVASAVIHGVEADTVFFVGNYSEKAELQATYAPAGSGGPGDEEITKQDFAGWETILPPRACGPSQRRAWRIVDSSTPGLKPYTHVRLLMYPDGGFGRLRLYGHAIPPGIPAQVQQASTQERLVEELSSALVGGLALSASDQHFSPCSNLLLPGREKDMGDGWETARSRTPGHVDWAIMQLGLPGSVVKVVVDTKDFRGNFPPLCQGSWNRGWWFGRGGAGAQYPGWVELVKGDKQTL